MRVGVVAMVVVGWTGTLSTPAEACAVPAQGVTLLAPVDLAEDVPINSVVSFIYTGYSAPQGDAGVLLRAYGGDPVAVTVQAEQWAHDWIHQVHLVPVEPLLPGQEYEIRLASFVLARFTTGDGIDDIAPRPPVVVSTNIVPDSDYETSCGDYRVRGVEITVEADEQVTFVIREDGRLLAEQDLVFGCGYSCGALIGDIVCDGRRWDESVGRRWELESGTHRLQISTRDWADNESSPTDVVVSADCPILSCNCHTSGSVAMRSLPVPALLVTLALRRRRRR